MLRDVLNFGVAAGYLEQSSDVPFPLPASKAKTVLKALGAEDGITESEHTLVLNTDSELQCLLGGPLPGDSAASYSVLVGVGNGVVYLHSQNVVHGDIKTQNVLLTSDNTPKLTDFGLSRAEQSTWMTEALTLRGGGKGTTVYMAPDLFSQGARASKATVMCAFGVMITEVLTGTAPFADVLPEAICG